MAATPNEKLSAAVDSLYEAFSCYARPTAIVGADGHFCLTNDPLGLLTSPLRELTADNLSDYCHSAVYTLGSAEDFKYYLPRILELLPAAGSSLLDVPMLFGRLPYAEWHTWPASERQSVWLYIDALWDVTLSEFPREPDAGDCLDGIAMLVDDLEPYLIKWRELAGQSLPALQQLIEFCALGIGDPDLGDNLALSAWLDNYPDRARQILSWVFSPQLRSIIERACVELAGRPPLERGAEWVWQKYVRAHEQYYGTQ